MDSIYTGLPIILFVCYINFYSRRGLTLTNDPKLYESVFKFLTYCYFVIGNVVFSNEYFFDTSLLWDKWPNQDNELAHILYYAQIGFYISSIIIHVLGIETIRSDWWPMLFHHFLTLTLISTSLYYNFVRVGMLIMLIHDLCDVFLELAKIANYLSPKSSYIFWIVAIFPVWGGLRIYYFPYHVLYSIYYETLECDCDESLKDFRIPFLIMLGMLMVLNVGWWFLMLKTVFIVLYYGKEPSDSRENHVKSQ